MSGASPRSATAISAGESCTTHLTVIDRKGNIVALTQTLLSVFGSRVMLPETGILMNNGIMWFDPAARQPQQPGARQAPLEQHGADGGDARRRLRP